MVTDDGVKGCVERALPLYRSRCWVMQQRWGGLVSRAKIPPRYLGCTPDRMVPTLVPPTMSGAISVVAGYRDNICERIKKGEGLIIKGPTGTLKTSAAVSCLMQALTRGYSGLFVLSVSLLDSILNLRALSPEQGADLERKIRDVHILLLDDVGDERSNSWAESKLVSLILERYQGMKSTIITTNLRAEELRERYAAKIIDRIRQSAVIVNMQGESLRKQVR